MKTNSETMKALALLSMFAAAPVLAEDNQSATEKAKVMKNDVKRGAQKAGNRVAEAVCTGSKVECEAKKAANRAEETKDKISDKAEELKDKVDADKK